MRVSSAGIVLHAKSDALDLGALARPAGLPVSAGRAKVDVNGTIAAGSADGHLFVEVSRAALYGIRDANLTIDATVQGRRVAGEAAVRLEDVGTFAARSSTLQVGPGRLTTPGPWRKTWGELAFEGHVDLAKLASRVPPRLLPGDAIAGALDVAGLVARDDAGDTTPSVDVTLKTTGFTIAGRKSGVPWSLTGIDPTLEVKVDGKTGRTTVAADLREGAAELARVDASSDAVPYVDIFSDADPVGSLRRTPFDAKLAIAPRSLAALPAIARPGGFAGELAAQATWHGPVASPVVDARVTIAGASNQSLLVVPMDLDAAIHFDDGHLDASLGGDVRKQRVLQADAKIAASTADLLAGVPGAWSGSGHVSLNHFSLRSIAALYDRQVRGTVSGEVRLDGLGRDARGEADLRVDGLQVNGAALKGGNLHLAATGDAIDGQVRIDAADGFLDGKLHLPSRWGGEVAPTIDLTRSGSASLSAKNLRAAFLLPFAPSSVTELDGRIDADVRADVEPGSRSVRPSGTIALQDGLFELATFGTEFHDVAALLTMTPDGIVRLEQASASGVTGSVRAAATARVDAAGLVGARVEVQMPPKDPLPLVFDGVPMGAIDGRFTLGVDRGAQGFDVKVDVPAAHIELPTGAATRDAQALGDVEGVAVGVRSRDAAFVPIALDRSRDVAPDAAAARKAPVHIAVKLGNDFRVSRGSDLDIGLQGQPDIVLNDETRVTGQIRLRPGGRLDVQGKSFEIESGAVTFVGADPANPQVVLTAGWSAPEGTRIYADFIGPLKGAQVKLRSSPAKTQNEILALLLYGSADDATDQTSTGDTANQSMLASAAGGAATQQLNQALGGVNRALDKLGLGGGISTKIDTSQVNPRPEVAVQIARDISLQVAWVLGAPPLTQPDLTFLTLDWRFLRKWSLETTVGDAGTSIVNVIWQHRY
jgi:translocation and assembly module TamB